ncbi:hypothetical protein [Novisyntrophococcus fermenticellae]|uniref:hypothetical protein n=1 Tax=Novisyntrophococcus fermenticellae TaxID=2068655 RepID=UPI001E5DAA8E|nr:hypothetical protein [Novisyntrophococcus fermenticellae]
MSKRNYLITVTSLFLFSSLCTGCGKSTDSVASGSHVASSVSSSFASSGKSTGSSSASSSPSISASSEVVDSPSPAAPTDTVENMHASGYVFSADDNIMYLDTENPGPRNYPHEGEDRQIAFDIRSAVIDITYDPILNSDRLRTSLSVEVDYYIKDGKNIATYVSGDGAEVNPIASEAER